MDILKESTKSLCPECLQEIAATVYEKSGKVYMEKKCPEHGAFSFLIERDARIYKRLMNKGTLRERRPFNSLMIAVTHKCNLDCPVCYLPDRNIDDFSLEDLKKIIFDFSGWKIRISGGEPTLRDDLPEIIRYICSRNKMPVLITNGLKLADRRYVKRLKEAGLEYICFSFNGFDDAVYRRLNGMNLLNLKLRALDSLIKEKIKIGVSIMLARGVNEKELKKVYRYCVKIRNSVYELRIRNSTATGKYLQAPAFSVSEIIGLLSDITGVDTYTVFDENFNENDHSLCRFDMDLFSLLSLIRKDTADSKLPYVLHPKRWRWLFSAGFLGKRFSGEPKGERSNFVIKIRCHQDAYNFDLGEIQRCPSAHLSCEGKCMLPLCQGKILNGTKIRL